MKKRIFTLAIVCASVFVLNSCADSFDEIEVNKIEKLKSSSDDEEETEETPGNCSACNGGN